MLFKVSAWKNITEAWSIKKSFRTTLFCSNEANGGQTSLIFNHHWKISSLKSAKAENFKSAPHLHPQAKILYRLHSIVPSSPLKCKKVKKSMNSIGTLLSWKKSEIGIENGKFWWLCFPQLTWKQLLDSLFSTN